MTVRVELDVFGTSAMAVKGVISLCALNMLQKFNDFGIVQRTCSLSSRGPLYTVHDLPGYDIKLV